MCQFWGGRGANFFEGCFLRDKHTHYANLSKFDWASFYDEIGLPERKYFWFLYCFLLQSIPKINCKLAMFLKRFKIRTYLETDWNDKKVKWKVLRRKYPMTNFVKGFCWSILTFDNSVMGSNLGREAELFCGGTTWLGWEFWLLLIGLQ